MNERDEIVKEIEELRADIISGDRARRFAEGEFYKKDLLPILEGIQEEAAFKSLFSGDPKLTADQIAINTAFQGGRSRSIEQIVLRLQRMINDGPENAERLKMLEEKLRKSEAKK